MGLVALTLGFLALGAYIGRDLSGGWGILAFIASFGCIIGLNVASARGNEQVSITLLFGLGLLLGLALGPVLSSYVDAEPAAVWQAAGSTGAFVAGLVIFGGYTILDFNRLRRSGQEEAVPIAASIFLDVLHLPLLPPAVRRGQRLTRRRTCL
jgi:FtsH-binding integral membrane protein